MNELEKRVLHIIANHPGILTEEIAEEMQCSKQNLYPILYQRLNEKCIQGADYRWSLRESRTPVAPNKQDEKLSAICKYYLNCLSLENDNGVSAFLQAKRGSKQYVELPSLNVDGTNDEIAKLIRQISPGNQLTTYVGYPVLIEKFFSRRQNQAYFKVAPVFLFPISISEKNTIIHTIPQINIEIIKQYSSRDPDSRIYDLVDLENELGLNSLNANFDLSEIVARLQAIRNWQWRETLNPNAISSTPPIHSITQEGIYNRSILIVSERSPYTIGLEAELLKLSKLDKDSYQNTALYDWIHNTASETTEPEVQNTPLLEVLPINSEQEKAIKKGIKNKLTVVTGPPGTGKSQIVTNLLINAAWNGKTVLFTSKNNKAVDVVEARVNNCGTQPIMIRMGANRGINYLTDRLSDFLTKADNDVDEKNYQELLLQYHQSASTYQEILKQKEQIIAKRNQVDALEKEICAFRERWERYFPFATKAEIEKCETALERYCIAYDTVQQLKRKRFQKILFYIFEKQINKKLLSVLTELQTIFQKYNLPVYEEMNLVPDTIQHQRICETGKELCDILLKIHQYRSALNELSSMQQLDSLDSALQHTKNSFSEISNQLWNLWLLLRSLYLTEENRTDMGLRLEFTGSM